MGRFVLLGASDTPQGFQPAGFEFEFDGAPNRSMQPLDDEAREQVKAADVAEAARIAAAAPLVPGMDNSTAQALVALVADAVIARLDARGKSK